MPNVATIKLNKEFRRAYYQGKYRAHPLLVTYRMKNRGKRTRIGITASKKIGGAVQRNRARRIIRQAFWELWKEDESLHRGYDYVFVARSATVSSNTPEIKRVMKKQLEKLEQP